MAKKKVPTNQTVGYYRLYWYYKASKGMIRLYNKNDEFIEEGNITFSSMQEMKAFADMFLNSNKNVAYVASEPFLSCGKFALSQMRKKS